MQEEREEQRTTMCPMNCHPTQCGMTVTLKGETVVRITGDANHPESRGFLCQRGFATREIFANPRRLLTPLRRAGKRGEDNWEACSWEEALERIVEAINATQRDRVGIWRGHGAGTTGVNSQLIARFGTLGGLQNWSSSIVCWALGGYGLGLTGLLEANTKEDMAENAQTILVWGATFASQPGSAAHLIAARKRGAKVIQIDTRQTELSVHADQVLLLQPGTDAALALALAHVLVEEKLIDRAFLAEHTVGFDDFAEYLKQFTPEWAGQITGLRVEDIYALARIYARETPSMIMLGGSSMYKHQHGWEASRAISCLPALTGQVGKAGAGMGPRHGAFSHSDEYTNINKDIVSTPGDFIPSHMNLISQAFQEGRIDVLFLLGTNMLSSFADSSALAEGLARTGLIVAYDLFMNESIRQVADLILPATAWLEDMGLKQTATHIYLMEQLLEPEGEARPLHWLLPELAARLHIPNVYPWQNQEEYLNALLSEQQLENGQALTVAELRKRGGYWQRSNLSPVAYPDYRFHTPSGKIEFWSERADRAGLSPLPGYTPQERPASSATLLRFCQGRTLTAFHSFYDDGQALPSLARINPAPELWIHPRDARQRQLQTGDAIIIANERGQFEAVAQVTDAVLRGVVWMRDGWSGLNKVTSGTAVLSIKASEAVAGIPGGQAAYDAWVEVTRKDPVAVAGD